VGKKQTEKVKIRRRKRDSTTSTNTVAADSFDQLSSQSLTKQTRKEKPVRKSKNKSNSIPDHSSVSDASLKPMLSTSTTNDIPTTQHILNTEQAPQSVLQRANFNNNIFYLFSFSALIAIISAYFYFFPGISST
jgi:hypothetical protein